MVCVAEIQLLPRDLVSLTETPAERTPHWQQRRKLDDTLEERADAHVNLDHSPFGSDQFDDELLDPAHLAAVDIVERAPNERLHMNFL